MAVNLSPYGGVGAQFLDNSGNVLTGGKIYTYAAGTTTPQVTYSNSAGTTPHSNPIVLDASGRVPSGEIWLTDGLVYKFVLKDSNDVLIATYDYISGINSNFVAYTNQQEIQTATAGQTVFTLTTATYQPGTNSLSVFVDGVNQYGPGSSYAYLETSSNTVTFVTGLHVGAEVKFTTSQLNSSGGSDAYNVSYLPPFTGAVATNVGLKLAQTVSFKDFGAVGDGSTNDAVAIQAAITNAAGKTIDGQGLTYKINSPITGVASNTVIQNAVFDFSNMAIQPGVDRCITVTGTLATPVSLTANTAFESNIVTVGSTSTFAADDLVFLKSNTVWDSSTSTTYGQYARVKSVDSSTQLTLYSSVLVDFTTADSATIGIVTPVQNVTFTNVKFIGANANGQNALYIEYGEDCNVNNCQFEYFDYLAVGFWRCYNSTIDSTRMKFARQAGNAYGFAIHGGCYGCSVTNSWGEDCRHTVTIGDNDGLNIFTRIENNTAVSNKDAGFDSHSASIYTTFNGNMVEMSADRFLTSNHDGIIIQGAHAVITNNTVVGFKGSGIVYQPVFQNGYKTSAVIMGNKLVADDTGYVGTGGVGIYCIIDATGGADINGVTIKGNAVSGGANNVGTLVGYYVNANKANSTIDNIIVEGNVTSSTINGTGILVRAGGASSIVSNVNVANNTITTSSANGIYFLSSGTSSTIENITGGNNVIDAVTTGIIFNDSVGDIKNIRFGYNIYNNVVNRFSVLNSQNYILLDSTVAAPITVTNSTYTIVATTNKFIFNRAGTITVTLPDPTITLGITLMFKTIQAQSVVSASSNVVPIDSATAGTAILPATDGAWATLYSDGVNWIIMARGT